ncbi:ribosome small subunit-dependent GTPase A [Streptacidiphilus monticola]|uniref:Small ribosomal subunit biogenesis GTPase RsgA n=1 Tax=Streptacidiphilus monticola TaxID=2161674 RepID=A0ABW1G3Q4_9ACTN
MLLSAYGWTPDLSDLLTPVPGRVVRVDRGRCEAVTPDGLLSAATDPAQPVVTGDWVALATAEHGPYVRQIAPRRTLLQRSSASRRAEAQLLAANVDTVLIAVSLAVEPDLARVERFLALAWESGAAPVVVLTKADAAPDAEYIQGDVTRVAPEVPVLAVSAERGTGLDALRERVRGGTSVLLGQSGAGKSTLVNMLTGRQAMVVRAIGADGKGRHTTTTRELLPLPGGGVLIDTPGLRGVGLHDQAAGLHRVFAEIETLAAECRFADCRHTAEPGCAVLAAVDDGLLPVRRLESYRKLGRENARAAARAEHRDREQTRKAVLRLEGRW